MTACLEHLFFRLERRSSKNKSKKELAAQLPNNQEKGGSLSLNIVKAVVIDDAFGPPSPGAVSSEDKDSWGDAVAKDACAIIALRAAFGEVKNLSDDELIATLTGETQNLRKLWFKYKEGALAAAHLRVLFNNAEQALTAKADKANTVIEVLASLIGAENVSSFDGYEEAAEALANADLAVVDFYLNNNDDEAIALQRIADAAPVLTRPKLLFFMSSVASLELQKRVRAKIKVRSAFFDVMSKPDITAEFLKAKVKARSDSYESNVALELIIEEAVKSTRQAVSEFEIACEELEVHDLRLLNLARLDAENESLQEYLTWLFSEALAAKARRLALPKIIQKVIEPESIGFSGQIEQGQILFDMYSEVVFAPPTTEGKPVRFGELLRSTVDKTKFLLVLTPACDLQRCDPSKMVLCTSAISTDYSSPKSLAKEKLFGKHSDGRLCHLFTERKESEKPTFTLLDWQVEEVETHTVKELLSSEYVRMAVMNELFAQEVKEDVLRAIGRVGTQIDPPPPLALKARIRWRKKDKDTPTASDMPDNAFAAAILTYSEQKENGSSKKIPTLILSDEFKLWAKDAIETSFGSLSLPIKLTNAIESLGKGIQFKLPKGFKHTDQGLLIRVMEPSDDFSPDQNAWLEVILVSGTLPNED